MSEFSKLLSIEGVDGIAVMDAEFKTIESEGNIPEQLINDEALSQLFPENEAENEISSSILMCEAGVWHISKLSNMPLGSAPAYLAVLAGKEEAVDIEYLDASVRSLKLN